MRMHARKARAAQSSTVTHPAHPGSGIGEMSNVVNAEDISSALIGEDILGETAAALEDHHIELQEIVETEDQEEKNGRFLSPVGLGHISSCIGLIKV